MPPLFYSIRDKTSLDLSGPYLLTGSLNVFTGLVEGFGEEGISQNK